MNNPVSKPMIKLMWDGETLAGHYAVSPVELIVNGDVSLTSLSMTTMTHPDYAGRGIFTTLAESLYKTIQEKFNVTAVWGFPNRNSHYGFIKNLKWKDLAAIPTLKLEVESFRRGSDENIEVIENFTTSHYSSFLSNLRKDVVSVNRTKEYLEWRYVNNPSNKYIIFEVDVEDERYYAVAKTFLTSTSLDKVTEIDIVELCVPTDVELIRSLVSKVLSYYEAKNTTMITSVNLWLSQNDPKYIMAEKLGFTMEKPITYFGIRSLESKEKHFETIHNWQFSMGDSDIY